MNHGWVATARGVSQRDDLEGPGWSPRAWRRGRRGRQGRDQGGISQAIYGEGDASSREKAGCSGGVDGLDDADVSRGEGGFAVFEVVVPLTDEAVVRSPCSRHVDRARPLNGRAIRAGCGRRPAPRSSRPCRNRSPVRLMRLVDPSDAEEQGAGENVFLDEVGAASAACVIAVRHGDHLDGEEAVRGEDLVAFGEVGFEDSGRRRLRAFRWRRSCRSAL